MFAIHFGTEISVDFLPLPLGLNIVLSHLSSFVLLMDLKVEGREEEKIKMHCLADAGASGRRCLIDDKPVV